MEYVRCSLFKNEIIIRHNNNNNNNNMVVQCKFPDIYFLSKMTTHERIDMVMVM